ncbi:L-fucose:H+ symporter permease [Priestia megaterium]|uniref:L-fucose:H+ symporter permease n=1 Tax=Priestia megaterium TaxID=1404 RepID=UPI000BF3B1DE|nr:L-fucose:H+ symporter permease [Priestia megaterium]MCM3151817.1 L-fucose:H+ symporter permease [Priestia megaterium]PFW53243.1 L-fucose:H+ symporter permease [Priestia megaterium]
MKHKNLVQMPNGYLNRTPIFQFILLSILFPLWGAAASLNDILIAQFKSVFTLSDFATAFVQSAFYGGYFLIAIPASLIIKKTNYKLAVITGLIFYIIGCSLFFPASHMATYSMFLCAIFAIAIGLGFLETSANTYSSMMGPRESAVLRLNISQTFTPIGSLLGIVLGKYLIFQEGESLDNQLAKMSSEEAHIFGLKMLQHTLQPYKYMILVLIAVLVLFLITKYPSCKAQIEKNEVGQKSELIKTLKYLGGNSRFRKGIIAQFLYVGMQVAVWSFTIRLALDLNSEINERSASNFMIYSFIAFFVGKFVANLLMTRFSAKKVLVIYSIIGTLLLAYTSFASSTMAVYAAVAVSMLFGPCWATIYSETLEIVEEKQHTEVAGAILVMAIVGGAVIPAVQGLVSDLTGSLQLAFLVPTACFIYVGYYFYSGVNKLEKVKKLMNEDQINSAK